MRRLRRYAAMALIVVAALAIAGTIVLESPWLKERARRYAVDQAQRYLQGDLTIERLRGDWWSGIELHGVRLSQDGEIIVAVDRVVVSYHFRELFRDSATRIRSLRLENLQVRAVRRADGAWNLANLLKPRDQPGGAARPLVIDRLEIANGTVTTSGNGQVLGFQVPGRVQDLNVVTAFSRKPGETRLDIVSAAVVAADRPFRIRQLSGQLAFTPGAIRLETIALATDRTDLRVHGAVRKGAGPATFDLRADARSFDFQEFSQILPGVRSIGVTSAFSVRMLGPRQRMRIDMQLTSSGGNANGQVLMDFLQPGWHASGTLDLTDIDVARWFSKPDKVTRITGRSTFDLDLGIGQHFPAGPFSFNGSRAEFAGYAASSLSARGRTTRDDVVLDQVHGTAYGAAFSTRGRIGLADPYTYRLAGHASAVDLRRLPRQIPVPHVSSLLAFDYVASGRFARPQLVGDAVFAESEFVGAHVGQGMKGHIDTTRPRLRYSGAGTLTGVNLNRFGRELDVTALLAPRFAGTVGGTFDVVGDGTDAATMELHATGRVRESDVFSGHVPDAAMTLDISGASVAATFDGPFERLDLAHALDDRRFASELTGSGRFGFDVREWLVRDWTVDATTIDAALVLQPSKIGDVAVDRSEISGTMRDGALRLTSASLTTAGAELRGRGTVALTHGLNDFTFELDVTDPSRVPIAQMSDVRGHLDVRGTVRGTADRPEISGTFKGQDLQFRAATVRSATGDYRVAIPGRAIEHVDASMQGVLHDVSVAGQTVTTATLVATYADTETSVTAKLEREGTDADVSATLLLHPDHNEVHLERVRVAMNGVTWHVEAASGQDAPVIQWRTGHIEVAALRIANETGDQRVEMSGTVAWIGNDGRLRIEVPGVQLDSLDRLLEPLPRYSGLLTGGATISGNIREPNVDATVTVVNGGIRKVHFDRLSGTAAYADGFFHGKVRVDQGPGVWLEVAGKVPRSFGRPGDRREIDATIKSSSIDLALIAGLLPQIGNPHGTLLADVGVRGTAEDPHVTGRITVSDASFVVAATGARYTHGAIDLALAPDLATVNQFHLEDDKGDPLDISGTVATHELSIRELALDVSAGKFELLSNDYGDVDVDALLQIQGPVASPTVAGDVILRHGQVNLNPIIARTFRRPYRPSSFAEASSAAAAEAPAPVSEAPTLWSRLAIAVRVSIPDDLTMKGDELSPSGGFIGLGDVRVTAGGDLSFRKGAGGPLLIVGPLSVVRGTYAFQGRRFDLVPDGEIRFTGETPIDPTLSVTARRTILGVETSVAVTGTWRNPQLRLSSSPPLDEADILSLIVFNQSTNELLSAQRAELGTRAAALASGFVTTPLLNSLSRALGFDTLAIDPLADASGAPRITATRQIGDRLFVTYVRQLGTLGFNEALIEYEVSRAFRIHGALSDSRSFVARQNLFERIERFGIDFLFFFSY